MFFRPVVLVQSFFFYQVEKSRRASSLLPFGARSNVAPPNDALALTNAPRFSQSYTTSARSRPTGTARAGPRPPRSAGTSC